jgi:arylsulfatase A-like enzyme
MDDAIGRILDQIDASGLRESTLVIFLSDNGAFMLPDRGLEVASNAPFRAGGVTLYEGGIRVPCIVRWPSEIPAGSTCDEPLISLDLLPLALAAAEVEPPLDLTLDGLDPTEALTGRGPSPHDTLVFAWREGEAAVRRGPFKLHRPRSDAPWALYDLDADLGETRDLAADRPSIVAELSLAFDHWSTETTRP